MNIELKPIAESKVRQLGGDVCGVLVRKGGKLAAVDEHGRVQWLQDGEGAEPVALLRREIGETSWFDHNPVKPDTPEAGWIKNSNIWDYCEVYTHPQPAQQGGVPEGHVAIPKDVAAAKGMYLVGYSWLKHNAPQELATPQPEGDGWLRLPGDANNHRCLLYTPSEQVEIEYRIVPAGFVKTVSDATHYMPLKPPTGLKRPQPPQEGA